METQWQFPRMNIEWAETIADSESILNAIVQFDLIKEVDFSNEIY